MKHYLLLVLVTICIPIIGFAQSAEYTLFKSVIDEIHQEHQATKEEKVKAFEKSSEEVKPYQNQKPQVSVLGMEREKAEKLEKELEDAFDPESKPKKQKAPKSPKPQKNDNKIKFKQEHMEDGKGEALQPAYNQKPQKTEWKEVYSETSTYEVKIEDLNVSDEKKKEYTIIGNHNGNFIALQRIGFIEAIHKELQNPKNYPNFKKEMKAAGYDLDPIMKESQGFEGKERNAFIKARLMEIINKVVNR